MAGGPIFPFSAILEQTDEIFSSIHFDVAAVEFYIEGFGVQGGGPSTDRSFWLSFQVPPVLPSGTPKLVLQQLANANSGNSRWEVKWRRRAPNADPLDEEAYVSEGAIGTGWTTGGEHLMQQLKWTLDAHTILGGDLISMEFIAQATSWNLVPTCTFWCYLIWE